MTTAPSANDLTRQQLDELDALLQRMLALPLNGPDAATALPTEAPPVPNWRVDPPAPMSVPPPHRPRPPEAELPFVPANPFAHPEPVAAPEPAVAVADLRTMTTTTRSPLPVPLPPPPPPETVPVVLWPLVAFNWVVDLVLGQLGPPGRVLRSGFGKNVLGLAGILLLVYTAAHAARAQGWVSLPVPLPWPR